MERAPRRRAVPDAARPAANATFSERAPSRTPESSAPFPHRIDTLTDGAGPPPKAAPNKARLTVTTSPQAGTVAQLATASVGYKIGDAAVRNTADQTVELGEGEGGVGHAEQLSWELANTGDRVV